MEWNNKKILSLYPERLARGNAGNEQRDVDVMVVSVDRWHVCIGGFLVFGQREWT